jgi:hypothetical protein
MEGGIQKAFPDPFFVGCQETWPSPISGQALMQRRHGKPAKAGFRRPEEVYVGQDKIEDHARGPASRVSMAPEHLVKGAKVFRRLQGIEVIRPLPQVQAGALQFLKSLPVPNPRQSPIVAVE